MTGKIKNQKNFLQLIVYVVLLFLLTNCQRNKGDYATVQSGESCVNCHHEMTGFSTHHDPQKIGCASCHLGNTKEADKDKAHIGMILIPGNFSNVSKTCASAQCHAYEWSRVEKSLMTSNSGIISVDKFLFNEIHTVDTLFHIDKIGNSPSETHIKNYCYTCHLGKEKTHYAAVDELSRGGGCLACHLNYQNGSHPNVKDHIHPQINLDVDNGKCFGCHSRSGRISTNYEGWSETLLTSDEVKGKTGYRKLMDGRIFEKAPADVHHQAGMQCIDCHSSQEIMGNGNIYKHAAEAVKIQCSDCHQSDKKSKGKNPLLNTVSIKDYHLRGYEHSMQSFVYTQKDSIPLVNTYHDAQGNGFLVSKISKKEHSLNRSCKRDQVHNNVSCSMCHTAWAPSCIGCHTDYDPNYTNKDGSKGRWIEHVAEFGYLPPAIGVKNLDGKKEFVPVIPGMIMTLDQSKFSDEIKNFKEKFVRWYAPNAAHTTTKEVRDCASCHTNPQALGFGRGTLTYVIEGKKAHWDFQPYYAYVPQDGLPHDAWIGLLQEVNPKKTYSSHAYLTPLGLQDQKKMLQVGTCIQCHGKDAKFLNQMIEGEYSKMVKNKTKNCITNF